MSKYTDEQISRVVESYREVLNEDYDTRSARVSELACELDCSVHAIRTILARRKIYKRKAYQTKRGTKPITKEELVRRFETYLGLSEGSLESFEKVNKGQLQKVILEFLQLRNDDTGIFEGIFENS